VRLRAFCALRSLRSARRRNLGFATFRPSDRTAKCVRPRSLPISESDAGSGSSPASTAKLAKYRPVASTITVTLVGSDGRSRDQRTGTSPIFGSRSFPPVVMVNRALRVNRIACTTADTSPSHARSGVALTAVSRADISASVMYGSPFACASCRARSPSLNTTRAHPNALARA
jgi:hypothetical protein